MNKKFDISKIKQEAEPSSYMVEYYVYKNNGNYSVYITEEDVKNKKYKKNTTKCCFSQLSTLLTAFSNEHKEWPNRLLFLCDFKKHGISKYHTTYEEMCWWITTCKKYKLLPDYINYEFAKTGNFILKIDTLDLNTIYIYLTVARYLQEEPCFVKAIKYLVDDKGMNFYTAFIVGSRCCIGNTGHHIIPVGRKYPPSGNHNNINFIASYDLKYVIRLKKFLNKEKSTKDTPLKNMKIGTSISSFNLHRQLGDIAVKETIVTQSCLLSKNVTE